MKGIRLLIMKGIGLLIRKGIGLLIIKRIGLLIMKGIKLLITEKHLSSPVENFLLKTFRQICSLEIFDW